MMRRRPQLVYNNYGGVGIILPGTPSNLAAATDYTTSGKILLTWTDNATDETAYSVERGTDGVVFVEIATPAANATSYSDTGLTNDTLYYYRVRANRLGVYSAYSSVATGTPRIYPGDIAGMIGWWDASAANLTKDGSNLISQVNDQSGDAHHVTATLTERPLWVNAALNSLPVMRFNGTTNKLEIANFLDATKKHVFYIVCRRASVHNGILVCNIAGSGLILRYRDNGGSPEIRQALPNSDVADAAGTNVWTRLTWQVMATSAVAGVNTIRQDGVLVNSAPSDVQSAGDFPFSIGSEDSPPGLVLNGDIAEIFLYDGAHSAGNVSNLELRLKAKYGL